MHLKKAALSVRWKTQASVSLMITRNWSASAAEKKVFPHVIPVFSQPLCARLVTVSISVPLL